MSRIRSSANDPKQPMPQKSSALFRLLSLNHPKCARQLVRTGSCLRATTDTFQLADYLVHRHIFHKPTDSLQISIATTIKKPHPSLFRPPPQCRTPGNKCLPYDKNTSLIHIFYELPLKSKIHAILFVKQRQMVDGQLRSGRHGRLQIVVGMNQPRLLRLVTASIARRRNQHAKMRSPLMPD